MYGISIRHYLKRHKYYYLLYMDEDAGVDTRVTKGP